MKIKKLSGFTTLALTFLTAIISFFTKSYYLQAMFMIWMSIIFVYFGLIKQAVKYLVVYIILIFWLTVIIPRGIIIISPMLLAIIYKFILPSMAVYLTFKIPSGKIIAIFQKMSIPQDILLSLIIIIRFIPSISEEIRSIGEAMKIRKIIDKKINIILHPLRTFTYLVVPLVFRSIKVGDELASAAIVRGIESKEKKQSYYDISLYKQDYVILTITIILVMFCLFWEKL